jgi:hypothetical protein
VISSSSFSRDSPEEGSETGQKGVVLRMAEEAEIMTALLAIMVGIINWYYVQ